jgi:hypothetical protein
MLVVPSPLGKRDPILGSEVGELRLEQPAQDLRALFEVACGRELSHPAFNPHQAPRLHHRTDVVEDNTCGSGRRQHSPHHRKYATKRRADKYGRSDLESDQDRREVGECKPNSVLVGISIVLGLAVTAVIERQHKSRIGRIGCQCHRQDMKIGCRAGETREAYNWNRGSCGKAILPHMQREAV